MARRTLPCDGFFFYVWGELVFLFIYFSSFAMLAQIGEEHYNKLNEILQLAQKNLKNVDESLIQRAFFMCYRAHDGEKRASG